MKILCICAVYYPNIKCMSAVYIDHPFNKALVRKGVEVDVFTTDAGIDNTSNIPLNKWVDQDGVKVKYFRAYGYQNYIFSLRMLLELLRCAKDYDIFYVLPLWDFPALAGYVAARIHHKPYIICLQGTLYREAIDIKSKNKKLIYYKLVARQYIKNATAVRYLTEDEKEYVINTFGLKNKAFVVPNGIDISLYRELPPKGLFVKKNPILKNKRYILFLGRIHPIKGLNVLMEAFKRLSKLYNDLMLVVAGPEDYSGYGTHLKNILGSAELSEKVLFVGKLFGEEKISVCLDAEIFVLPSYSEGLPVAMLEAMACGLPVIASKKIRINKILKENRAAIVTDINPDSLFSAVQSLLADEQLRKEIGENGRRLVEKYYDIDKMAEALTEVFKELLRYNVS